MGKSSSNYCSFILGPYHVAVQTLWLVLTQKWFHPSWPCETGFTGSSKTYHEPLQALFHCGRLFYYLSQSCPVFRCVGLSSWGLVNTDSLLTHIVEPYCFLNTALDVHVLLVWVSACVCRLFSYVWWQFISFIVCNFTRQFGGCLLFKLSSLLSFFILHCCNALDYHFHLWYGSRFMD